MNTIVCSNIHVGHSGALPEYPYGWPNPQSRYSRNGTKIYGERNSRYNAILKMSLTPAAPLTKFWNIAGAPHLHHG